MCVCNSHGKKKKKVIRWLKPPSNSGVCVCVCARRRSLIKTKDAEIRHIKCFRIGVEKQANSCCFFFFFLTLTFKCFFALAWISLKKPGTLGGVGGGEPKEAK